MSAGRVKRLATLALMLLARGAAADEVLVRGARDDEGASGFVSSARVEDAPREVTDAASLVEPLAGVHVRRLGGDDSFATLSVRGTSSTQVAVYLAGVPLTGGADPSIDLATLPLWPGAEAKVYRSFAPAALGPGSLGGTLVLDPPSVRSATTDARTDVWTAIGSFGARRLRVSDLREVCTSSCVRIASGVSASRSDDDFTYLDPLASQSGSDVYTTRKNAGHAEGSGLVSLSLPVPAIAGGDGGALTFTALAQARKQGLPGPLSKPTLLASSDTSRLLAAMDLTEGWRGSVFGVRAWARREGFATRDTVADAVLGPTRTDDTVVAGGVSASAARRGARTTVEARVEGTGERYAPGTWEGAAQPPPATRSAIGAGVDASHRLDVATLAASARADAWFDGSGGTTTDEARPTGHVGVEAPVGPVTVASHAGYLSRPASFIERFGDHGLFLGDPTLKPESAATVDVGAHTSRSGGAARAGWSADAEVALFATWASELIVFVNQGAYGRAKATNIGEARLLGVEASARAAALGFELRVSYTGLATANESDCREVTSSGGAPGCERPPLPGRPENDFVGDLVYRIGDAVRLRYGADVVTGTRADLTGSVVVPDRVLQSAGLRVSFGAWARGLRGLTLALDVRNLFDVRVAEYAGVDGPLRAPLGDIYEYPLPGRSFLASARFTAP